MSWKSWRRVRQAVQIIFFILYIILIFSVVQRRVAPPLADIFFRLDPFSALGAMLASRQWIAKFALALVTVGSHTGHRPGVVWLDLPIGQPAGVGILQKSTQTGCLDLSTLEVGKILPAGHQPGAGTLRRADPAGARPDRHFHAHADHSHPARAILRSQFG